jgi:flagellar basal-body rod protein FlgC
MGILDILKVSASALKAQRTRMEVIASNLANVHTSRTEEGGPYRKKEVLFGTVEMNEGGAFGSVLARKVEGVQVQDIAESPKPFEKIHDPGHPDADKDGYVTMPNVNVMEEMADMIAATRAYEANVNVVHSLKEMFLKALEIGK